MCRRRANWQRLKAVDFAWPAIPLAYVLVGACMMGYGVIWQTKASLTAMGRLEAKRPSASSETAESS